ncbi:MAG TPA: ABC transporter ATP-binding protein [Candidatus Limnocylindria bacterium]|nr:ABC transporter ATP-binding protein [Candidatus Limnocylindria bacterium]
MLEIRGLSVSYDHIDALSGVSFSVPDGAIVSIIGSNGAGKSTLINTISGLVRRKAGDILLDGKPLPASPHRIVRKGIVQVPEGRKVFANLTVRENLVMGGARVPAGKAAKKIDGMLDLFPILAQRRGQMAGTLSGGEQQMLAIARGLMAEPRILLMDEPSLGLAPIIVRQVFDTIVQINRTGVTVLLVEQNANQAMAVSGYTYVLENGHIVRQGESGALRGDRQIRENYLGVLKEESA